MQRETIGMVGLGLLGAALAERLLGAGFAVYGCDIDAGRRKNLHRLGGTPAESAREVAVCRRIVLSLPDSGIAGEVVSELAPALAPESIVVDTTTGQPRSAAARGQELSSLGAHYLDATVAGSSEQAREGDVLIVAGGEPEVFGACADLFAAIARKSFHVGPCGAGTQMKLVVNLVLGLNRAVLAEGLTYAKACRLDPNRALEILMAGPTYSRVMDTKGRKMLDEDFAPQARLAQHRKDVRLILGSGAEHGAKLPLSTLHMQLLDELVERGFGDVDNSIVIKAFE